MKKESNGRCTRGNEEDRIKREKRSKKKKREMK